MYKLGLVSISFRKYDVETVIKKTEEAGLSRIEWGSDVHAPKDDIEKLNKIVLLQKKYGINCCSYGTYFRFGETPTEELESYIRAAKILGTDILRLWCGNKNSQDYSDSEKAHLFGECIKAAEIARKSGVKLCMECHNGTFTDTKESALELMRAVSSSSFRMYWQPNQYRTEEENLRYAEAVSDYTEHIHIFNWNGERRFPLKDGIDIWKKYLKKFGDDKTLLLEFMPDDNILSLPSETEALKRITEVEKWKLYF